ncbi:C6 zinc finger domain containing protein [Colletotrichum truncatum]|uniref:C6 zinc finger domain containing protein n=1 Tax=Colletotrichum truncatum TaxID=5467 RepID=A0ACC3YHH4_COLTU|nr:C6 zinc finger domain containing protein [Colletotrichum truncatum]KAF6792868.1 C6 zinc finger domain containing protein [Colletotrichum truncatum]
MPPEEQQCYRIIKAGLPNEGSASDANTASPNTARDRKRRRPYVSKACDSCRLRKSACDGIQPDCSTCLRRGIRCNYNRVSQAILDALPSGSKIVEEAAASRNEEDLELLSLLRDSSDEQALEALRGFKEGKESGEITSSLRSMPSVGLGLSQIALNRAIIPPTRSSLEFELMVRHPVAYPAWAPVEASKLDLDYLLLPSKILWNRTNPIVTSDLPGLSASYPSSESSLAKEDSTGYGLVGPTNPPSVYDERLLELDNSKWTSLPVTKEFAVTVLSLYLEADHPMMPLFDIDVFLDGLLGKNPFCSRLLVNGLFSWACQGYAAFKPEATILGYAFFEDAKRLWRKEQMTGADNICTLAGLQYVAITAISLGAGAEYVECLDEVIAMAKRLHLFNVDPVEVPAVDMQDEVSQRAAAQIAWALFNTLTLLSTHIHTRLIKYPPRLPVPEGRIFSKGNSKLSKKDKRRQYLGVLLKENSNFYLIVHDMIQLMYSSNQTPYAKAYTLVFADNTYKRLLKWADSLPLELAQGRKSTHHTVFMHICYHLAILDLFRPLIRQHDAGGTRIPSFSSKDASPEAAYSASVNQLKRIVLFYRQTYPESSFSFFWHSALLYLANAMLREASGVTPSPEWRFYFQLCIASYQTLYSSYRLAKGITHSLLSMALERGAIDHQEANLVKKDLEERGRHHEISDRVPESYVVDLDLAVTDPSAAQAERLVQKFHGLLIDETEEDDGASLEFEHEEE